MYFDLQHCLNDNSSDRDASVGGKSNAIKNGLHNAGGKASSCRHGHRVQNPD